MNKVSGVTHLMVSPSPSNDAGTCAPTALRASFLAVAVSASALAQDPA